VVTFFTVLKYGEFPHTRNDYTPAHVYSLKKQIEKYYTKPHRFICFTDHTNLECETIKLLHDWPGWWAKIEMFQFPAKKVFYFDLDTVILNNIDNIVDHEHDFTALKEALPNRITDNLGSGIMSWSGDKSFIYENFKADSKNIMCRLTRGDQVFIQEQIRAFDAFQNIDKNIYSYKFTLQDKQCPPTDAKIIYFSGKPKPWQVDYDWIPEY